MIFTETELAGAYILDLKKFEDSRGFFANAWSSSEFEQHGLVSHVTDMNFSYNRKRGTVRGMHFQNDPFAQVKIVRCPRGAVYDVIVDLRPGSPTYTRWIGVELTGDNHRALYVPAGFAHGFQTLQDDSDLMYLVTERYAPGSEGGVRYNDPVFGIEWPLEVTVVSDKDAAWADFAG